MIYSELLGAEDEAVIVDPIDPTHRRKMDGNGETFEDLLVPIVRAGEIVYAGPALADIRNRTIEQLATLHAGILRHENPHKYPVGLELSLHEQKTELILKAREGN